MTAESPRPGLAALFSGFFVAGLSGFGGVLPFARRIMVERRG
ncbi:MAG: chromate transporter, partial [Acidiphilium sp. 37-67-22]